MFGLVGGGVRVRRWRRVTSVPLLSDRAIEKFPRFFACGVPSGANRPSIGYAPSHPRKPAERGEDGLYTLGRYLSRLQLLTSYRYRGHSPILYSPSFVSAVLATVSPTPPPLSRLPSSLALPRPAVSRFARCPLPVARANSVEFRLMNYMHIRCKFYRRANIYSAVEGNCCNARAGRARGRSRLPGVARERDGAALNSRRFLTLTGQSRRGSEISQRNEKSILVCKCCAEAVYRLGKQR